MSSAHGAATKLGVQDVAVTMGLPGELGGHGSEVAAMIERGNPTAHAPRIHWALDKADAEDLLTLVSLIHRRLDAARVPPRV